MYRLLQAIGDEIRIGRLFNGLTTLEHLDMLSEQLPVEGIRMVEVDGLTLFVGHSRRIVVIRVQWYYCCTMRWQHAGNSLYDGGLS